MKWLICIKKDIHVSVTNMLEYSGECNIISLNGIFCEIITFVFIVVAIVYLVHYAETIFSLC